MTVYAAGGVLWRRGDGGEVEVVIVHRPRYDDWSFPKGKRDAGESDEACALREVQEETGINAALGVELPSVSYVDRRDRPKVVRYWAMTVTDDPGFEPGPETDARLWLPVAEAIARLTYAHDVGVLEVFSANNG